METRFENKYTRTEQVMREYIGYFLFRTPLKRTCYIIASIAFAVCILSNAMMVFLEGLSALQTEYIISLLLFAALLYLVPFIRYRTDPKAAIKRDRELCGGNEAEMTFLVGENEISYRTPIGENASLPFSKIKKVRQTKGLILLISDARLCFIFKKDSFTVGTAEEFLAFLKEKGYKI